MEEQKSSQPFRQLDTNNLNIIIIKAIKIISDYKLISPPSSAVVLNYFYIIIYFISIETFLEMIEYSPGSSDC